jgi:hypothetical protein
MSAQRIDEVVMLLERFVLGEVTLSKRQIKAALRLLDLAIDDAPPPPDDGTEVLMSADDRVIWKFPRKFVS